MRLRVSGASLLMVCSSVGAQGQSSEAVYEWTIETHWTLATHGAAYIPSAHFSPLVGMVHSDEASMWEPGELASFPIERMAETGSSAELQAVGDDFVAAGTARERLVGPGYAEARTRVRNVRVTTNHPLITMVTMVAPSPDWFMGTHGVSLLDENGEWIDELVVPLEVYDSGTDSGPDFTSSNDDTQPPEPIRNIQDEPPFNGAPPLGTYTFRLLFVENCEADINGDGLLTPADFSSWIAAFNASDPAADQNGDGQVLPTDLNAWILNFNAGC